MFKRPAALLTAVSLAFFAWIHAVPAFGDPDAYYHLEMTRRTAEAGAVLAFPWLPFTTLAGHFADHHFLYHVALAPFVLAFGDYGGLKAGTAVFAVLAVLAFARLLRAYGVRRPEAWAALLLLAPGFVFRLLLTKATAPALAAFFLFLIALHGRHRAWAFGIAFAYVWLHGGWPILMVAAVVDAAVRRSGRMLWPTALGLLAGLVLNPFFPSNVFFYWEQIVQVAVLGAGDAAVLVGNEWHPSEFGALFLGNAWVFAPLAAAAVAGAGAIALGLVPKPGAALSADRRRDVVFVAALAGVFLLMALRQARHKEYFLPLALLAGVLVAETAFRAVDVRALLSRLRGRLGRLVLPVVLALSVVMGASLAYALHLPKRAYDARTPWSRFEGAGAWLRANAAPGETVFHARWDDFPQLWYRAPEQRYIAGLDALFLYRRDPELYWTWRDIGDGRRRDGLAELIRERFGAGYVLLRMGPDERLRPLIKKDPSFERVYADIDAEIWRVTSSR